MLTGTGMKVKGLSYTPITIKNADIVTAKPISVRKAAIREDLRAGGTLRRSMNVELTQQGIKVDLRA